MNQNQADWTHSLAKCPKSLYVLWQEYKFGLGGRKPVKLFDSKDRGKVKFKYCMRKHFWDLITKMIQHGYSHNSAIDKVYTVHSGSVTNILTVDFCAVGTKNTPFCCQNSKKKLKKN